MSQRILVNGASGKMGRLACEVIVGLKGFSLVAQCGRHNNLSHMIKAHQADIVIDFTTAETVYKNTQAIIEAGARPIIGTSGLQQSQVHALMQLARKHHIGGIIAPNFSISAVLMMQFAALAASHFECAEIIEMHHEKKADAPSGTAIRTAELMQEKMPPLAGKVTALEILDGARGACLDDIHIHSVRMPGIMARQQVIFGNAGETLTIEYNTLDRKAYASGIKLACQKVMQLDYLAYGLEKLLGIHYGK